MSLKNNKLAEIEKYILNKPTKMIIVAAPSGAGKSSFVERVSKEIPVLHDVVTYTTRKMRTGESQGFPYFFISKEDFIEKEDIQ